MKRVNGLYDRIADYDNLCLAFVRAAKGKHHKQEVMDYTKNLQANLDSLRYQIETRCFDIGHYHFFKVLDPKPRRICASSFPERVLHHAVMAVCEPVLETYAIHHSYACRKGKGMHKAVKEAQKNARTHKWFLKLDIRKYFDSIDHGIVLALLARRLKDKRVLTFFRNVLRTYHTLPGKGLPIGNLISQHLANFYLGLFDHWIKETKGVRGYIRYMDDFLVFDPNKDRLKTLLSKIQSFLDENLALELKANIQLNRCDKGIPFLGYRVFPWKIDLSPPSRKRFVRKFKEYEKKHMNGLWTEKDLGCHMEPLLAFSALSDARGFRNKIIKTYGVVA